VRGAGLPLRVAGIRKSYGTGLALDGITLDLAPGAFNTLLGPSGCGKTTLLRIVAGFVEPDEGRVYIGGEDRTDAPAWKRRIGFVFQSYALWPHMSVFDNVAYGLRLRRLSRDEVADRVGRALGAMDLAGAGARHPGQLSGGQQQRVALARALVLEPEVLLLDEPTSALDETARDEIERTLLDLRERVSIVLVTHDGAQAERLTTRTVRIRDGRADA
jgi:ABC-type Fe3+/spermidine/putrescine transport system ATPase subunit